jgi:hypothetical protein
MSDRLKGPRGKVERAKDHFGDLEAEVADFLSREPYRLVAEVDPQTREHVGRVRVSEDPPERITWIVGDLAHNLRSAFDYLAQQLVRANGGKPNGWTEFPIFWDAEKYKTNARGQVRRMSKEAVTLIDRMQPYHRAEEGRDPTEHALYIVHHLDNRDKHVDFTIVGSALRNATFGKALTDEWPPKTKLVMENLTIGGPQLMSPLKDGAELWRGTIIEASEVDMNGEATFDVAFDKAGAGKGQPVIPLCQQLINVCEGGIEQFAPFL